MSKSGVKKVVLAYSGGLDTSVILKWLREVYGCPDCADGGACTLSLLRNGAASTHTYDCSMGAPDVLAAAHEFWSGIVFDLESCQESPWAVIEADFDCIPLWELP